jgi:hypothetical protein
VVVGTRWAAQYFMMLFIEFATRQHGGLLKSVL